MNTPQTIAKHLHELFFGNSWTGSHCNITTQLEGITWKQATQQVEGFNSIATLLYHLSYYVTIQKGVLLGEGLNGSDKESFETPSVTDEASWDSLKQHVFKDVDVVCGLLQEFPEDQLQNDFDVPKYGSNLRNFMGLLEHSYYHLGQIVLLKKMVSK